MFLTVVAGERDGGQHQEHGQRHGHGADEAEPGPGQDQRQVGLRHPEGQDGQREGGGAHEVKHRDTVLLITCYYSALVL